MTLKSLFKTITNHLLGINNMDSQKIDLFENTLNNYCPKLKEHFDKIELPTKLYLSKWIESAFIK